MSHPDARGPASLPELEERRFLRCAVVDEPWTPRGERAAGWQLARVGWVTGEPGGRIPRSRVTDAGEGVRQRLRVRVPRCREHLVGPPELDDPAGVHHRHTIADVG